MNRVFVSYSRRNKTFTERLARDLADAGLDIWVDWRQIHAGEFWQEEIFRGIERADIIVIVLSPDAAKSDWVQREVNTGREQGKVIIPVMAVECYDVLQQTENLRWILDVHFIHFENRYEEGFTELLRALPGRRRVSAFDSVDPAKIPNPFKGLEAFQQTDAAFFFGRDRLIKKSLYRLQQNRPTRFLGVVGASGSGKSSLVRAGVIPSLRRGEIPGSENWRIVIFTPGSSPVEALAQRLAPLTDDLETETITNLLYKNTDNFPRIIDSALQGSPESAQLLMVVDQFEETFTRAGENERRRFLKLLYDAVTKADMRSSVLVTMRADFFDRIGHYPALANLFEQENMVIVTEMTEPELLVSIEGPAEAVGLRYDEGLAQRILDDVRSEPGSLPLLQYALTELYKRRDGFRLTTEGYEEIGGVQQALARHAEDIYTELGAAEQAIMRRILLRLIEVNQNGEATRRRVPRSDLNFRDVPDDAVQDILDLLTSAETRLLIASREIKSSSDQSAPIVRYEVSHEALIREWERFKGWVSENVESLRYGTELLQSARDWQQANQDGSYLLVGNRLVRAEVWLESADATQLQRDFIQASIKENERRSAAEREQVQRELMLQQQATTRLRLFVGVLVVGLIVAMGLTAFSVNSLEQAQNAQSTAIANQEQSVSLALAASANRANGDNDDEEAVMLAVEANLQGVVPSQSQRVLAEVAYARGTRLLLDEHPGAVNSGDTAGNVIAAAANNTVYIYNLQDGTRRHTLDGHEDIIRSVALNGDGTRAVSGGDDDLIIVWDLTAGAELLRLIGHSGDVLSVDYYPSLPFVVSADEDGEVILWDVNTGAEIRRFTGHDGAVNQVVFSADGDYIATAGADGQIIRYDITGSTPETRLTVADVENLAFLSVAFDPTDSNRIIAGGQNNMIYDWDIAPDIATDTPAAIFEGHSGQINSLAFSADGSSIISGASDDTAILWDVDSTSPINVYAEHDGLIYSVDFTDNDQHVLTASFDRAVRISDVKRAEEIHRFSGHTGSQNTVAVYGPADRTVISASGTEVRLWDVASQITIQNYVGHTDRVNAVAVNSAGTHVLTGGRDRTAAVWDIESGAELIVFEGHTAFIEAVAFSPDGASAITGDTGGAMIRWDAATGEILQRYGPAASKDDPGHIEAINDIAVSPDGTRIISASDDSTLVIWNTETGDIIATLETQESRIESVAYSQSGDRILSTAFDGSIYLWNVDEGSNSFGEVIRRYDGHDGAVFDAAFSPDEQTIASVSLDRTIRVWQISNGFELRRYSTGDERSIIARTVMYSRDGLKILTGMNNADLREWRLLTTLDDLLAWTFDNRVVPEPTCEQRVLFNIPPLCTEDGDGNDQTAPPRPAFVLPTPTAPPPGIALSIGGVAVVNTDAGDTLNLRSERVAGVEYNIVTRLEDGESVTLTEGPVQENGFTWWLVTTEDGTQGWAVEFVPEVGLRTLIPQGLVPLVLGGTY